MAEQQKSPESPDPERVEDLELPESESEDVKGGLQNLTAPTPRTSLDLNDLYVKGNTSP